ncbi:MAG: DUF4190 domain-containing protein [Marmoricola sp.]
MTGPTSGSYPGSDPDGQPEDAAGGRPEDGLPDPPAGYPGNDRPLGDAGPEQGQQQGQEQGQPGGWPAYPPQGGPWPGQPGQPGYGGPAYGQQGYGGPSYGQQGYGGPPPWGAYPPGPGAPATPAHPQAGLALGLGLGGLLGGFLCLLPLLISPFAWALGHRARKEIKAADGALGGDGMALAGMILGIIGSALLALLVAALLVFAVVVISDSNA